MMGLPLFMICGFSLQYFNTFFCIFNVSSIIWYVEFLVWSYLFGVLCVFLYLSKYIFSRFGGVFYDLGEDLIYTIHLGFIFSFYACDSWMLYVHNQCSYIFLLCVFGFVFYHFFIDSLNILLCLQAMVFCFLLTIYWHVFPYKPSDGLLYLNHCI